ncbi:hypothetical protein N9F54_02110 [Actinomycetota bacterium]|nr:hypothetical protein [Actinomycetota bacterium]
MPMPMPMSGYGRQYELSRLNKIKSMAELGAWLLGVAGIITIVLHGFMVGDSTGTMIFGILAAFCAVRDAVSVGRLDNGGCLRS